MSLNSKAAKAELYTAGAKDKFGKPSYIYDRDIVISINEKGGSTAISSNSLITNSTFIGTTNASGINAKKNIIKLNGITYSIDYVMESNRTNTLFLRVGE